MRNHRVTLLSAALIALTLLGATGDAEASRRKPRRPIIQGEIQQLSNSFVVLNNKRVELTPRTVYRDYADGVISRDAFTLGDCVKVKLIPGRLVPTAREMEMEDHCTATSGTSVVTPSPGVTGDDKGGRRDDNVRDDCQRDDSADRGRGRGRGRGRDDD
jgi:hypothetical protein